ncbi:MAG: pyrroline-5-carboxylate reductase family protein [Solirubrobacterales bacterium]
MAIGFIGSGNMARAMAIGIGRPAMYADGGSGRAVALADETGGSAGTVEEVAAASEVLFLCHKPAQLESVAERLAGFGGTIVSVLAATKLDALRDAYPEATVVRTMPNIPVEFGTGVVCIASESDESTDVDGLLAPLGEVIRIPEAEFELATAIGGCAPAFFALFAHELIASAERRGMDPALARQIVGQTLDGTGDVLLNNGVDTEAAMRAVASPGGLTEKALKSFDDSRLQDAIDRAVATVLGDDG